MNTNEFRPSLSLSRMDLITIIATRAELLRTYHVPNKEIKYYLVFLHNRTIIVKSSNSFYRLSQRARADIHAHPYRVAMQLEINKRTWGVLIAKDNIPDYIRDYAPEIDIKERKKFRLSLLKPRKH